MWGYLRITLAFIVAFTITASVAAQEASQSRAGEDITGDHPSKGFGQALQLRYEPADPPARIELLDKFLKQPEQITIRWI